MSAGDSKDRPDGYEPDVRFLLANERTLLAWLRTSIAIIAGALAVLQFATSLEARAAIGIALLLFGACCAGVGLSRYRAADRAIRADRLPAPRRLDQPRRLGGSQFRIVENHQSVRRNLPFEIETPRPTRSLPVLASENPCATAPCRTAEHTRGAACCRDLQVEIMCTRQEKFLEALVRSRRSPYLCKIDRAGDFSLEVEMISACTYLGDDGIACTLHGRRRADGRPAKPDLCSEWPPKNKGLHPGCVFAPGRRKARARG